jgi:hypothetical protein
MDMNRNKFASFGFATAAIATLFLLPQIGRAGTPLVCSPFDIGDAKSLPMVTTFGPKADYDLSGLVADTEALLAPDTPVIVRMETIRRATLYAQRDRKVAKDLLDALDARAASDTVKGQADALAWFDLGYLVETYKQANMTWKKLPDGKYDPVYQPTAASGIDGYAYVLKAINLRGNDPEMEFAAAVITVWPRQKSYEAHLRKALAGANDGSLLARNLVTHFGQQASTIAELRRQVMSTPK